MKPGRAMGATSVVVLRHFTRTGYGPFGDGTRVYLSWTRTAARHCRDLTGTRRTHLAVCPSISDADRSTCWAV
eukprot:6741727-Prymnesium_polylepis.1